MLKQLYRFLHPKFQNLFLEYKVAFKPRYGHGRPVHPELHSIIDQHRDTYVELIQAILSIREFLWEMGNAADSSDSKSPGWNNGFLPGLDIAALYGLMVHFQPRHYMEVGSGTSTKVVYKAKVDHQLNTVITSIDPQPRAEINELTDHVVRAPLEDIDLDKILSLGAGDMLFIDNTHRILPNSDATVFFLEILPRLHKGVIVHIHDVYLPYDYPQFMCDRFYSEQYGLAMYLLANPQKYQPLLANYFIYQDQHLADQLAPLWNHGNLQGVEHHGGSFWLRIAS